MNPLQKISSHLDGKLTAYATLAGVALAAPAMTPSADASIVYSGIVNINIPSTTAGIYINFVSGVFATTPAGAPGWDFNPWGSSGFNAWANNSAEATDGVIGNFAGGSSATLVDNLPFGTLVDGTSSYVRSNSIETTGLTAFTLSSSSNLVGIRFTDGANTYFGWIRISLSATSGSQPRALVEYAYENSGAGILAGVPEPSTFALMGVMAAGAVGVRAWRKRKAA